MRDAIIVLPYGNFALAKIHHPATAGIDVVETMHDRLAFTARVEFLRHLAVRIVDRSASGRGGEDLLSDEDPRRRAVADAPCVEPRGNVEIWRLRGSTDKREAVGTVVVLIDPPPGRIANAQVPARPHVEIAEMLGHIAL